MAHIARISAHRTIPLSAGWQVRAGPDGAWIPAKVPGTLAGALKEAGLWRPYEARDFDEIASVWRCSFAGEPGAAGTRVLCFDGLATLAEVFVNGTLVLGSQSMFEAHEVDVSRLLRGTNELEIRIAPLAPEFRKKRPRPRWKTNFIRNQQMRWVRTCAFGRVPSWPVVAPVGPWREVRLEERSVLEVESSRIAVRLEGTEGKVDVELAVRALEGGALPSQARLQVGGRAADLTVDRGKVRGALSLPLVEPWWPSTHGNPALHDGSIHLGDTQIDLGRIGFRRISADDRDGGFQLSIQDTPIFCRGACWSPPDVDNLTCDPVEYRRTLTAMRDAGMNMVRIPGAFLYEPALFHDLCDELGILVWQDFMFMAMDYPATDATFVAAASKEVERVARALETHPSLAVLCGGSDALQQPAFLGLPSELCSSPLFEETFRAICAQAAPGVPYVPNSPSGSAPAFRVDQGVAHYFGVGAYGRDLDDVRRSNVRFACESLAFANVPEQSTIDEWLDGGVPVAHPRWKEAVPRDSRASWDFDDVRDGYFERIYGLGAQRLRAEDPERYLELSRTLTGEMMEAVMTEWRSGGTCAGGLIWTLRDLRPGPGWGLLDANGRKKAAYWLVRRALMPRAVLLTDEGLNGMRVLVVNDEPAGLRGHVDVALYHGGNATAEGRLAISVPPRSAVALRAHDMLGRFVDISYAYRFGPPQHDVVVATLLGEDGVPISDAVGFSAGRPRVLGADPLIEARSEWSAEAGEFVVRLRARRFAYAVSLTVQAPCTPLDNYFHISPAHERVVRVVANGARQLRGEARPLNGAPVRIAVDISRD